MTEHRVIGRASSSAGRNCWRVEHAHRAPPSSSMRDAYFKAFVAAARQAQRSILITGWDFHSRTRLLCANDDGAASCELGDFLNDLARRRRELQIHILIWDYPMIFGLDREWAPLYGLGLEAASSHAFPLRQYASDRRLASSEDRRDRRSRRVQRRHRPHLSALGHRAITRPTTHGASCKGTPYPPFHDLMMAVEGDAARALGDLVRERWRKATATRIGAGRRTSRRMFIGGASAQVVDRALACDRSRRIVRDVEVAISRTEPAANGSSGVREVEALYLDMIAAATQVDLHRESVLHRRQSRRSARGSACAKRMVRKSSSYCAS